MARPKKVEQVTEESVEKALIQPLSIDFPSEQFNDMARKINEIIDHCNGQG